MTHYTLCSLAERRRRTRCSTGMHQPLARRTKARRLQVVGIGWCARFQYEYGCMQRQAARLAHRFDYHTQLAIVELPWSDAGTAFLDRGVA